MAKPDHERAAGGASKAQTESTGRLALPHGSAAGHCCGASGRRPAARRQDVPLGSPASQPEETADLGRGEGCRSHQSVTVIADRSVCVGQSYQVGSSSFAAISFTDVAQHGCRHDIEPGCESTSLLRMF